jgi:hypothetical protein
MNDKDPASEGFGERCLYCGGRLAGLLISSHIPRYGDGTGIERFCSEQCAIEYTTLVEEEWEEDEELRGAGAT